MAGHVRRRGGKWQARMPDPARGGTIKIERTFRTKVEAEQWLHSQQADLQRGEYIDPRKADSGFPTVVAAWKGTWINIEPKTRAGYEAILARYLMPAFGKRKVSTITTTLVQDHVGGLLLRGLAPGTVRGIYSVLRTCLNAAVRLRMVPVNPCLGVKLPRVPQRHMDVLDPDEVPRQPTPSTPATAPRSSSRLGVGCGPGSCGRSGVSASICSAGHSTSPKG